MVFVVMEGNQGECGMAQANRCRVRERINVGSVAKLEAPKKVKGRSSDARTQNAELARACTVYMYSLHFLFQNTSVM